jgi:hypothetical protein
MLSFHVAPQFAVIQTKFISPEKAEFTSLQQRSSTGFSTADHDRHDRSTGYKQKKFPHPGSQLGQMSIFDKGSQRRVQSS